MKEYVVEMDKFKEKNKNMVFKEGKKQVLLIEVNQKVFALDNRCPHEGYPLSEGGTNDSCVLTCNWHNWKFDLKTGDCLLGGDNVQTYPVEVRDDRIIVNLSRPSKDEVKESILKGFRVAFEKRQYGRLAREIARMDFNGLNPVEAFKEAIFLSYDKFEYGMTHAYAASADWLSIYHSIDSSKRKKEKRGFLCLTEAVDHMSYDSLRHPIYSLP